MDHSTGNPARAASVDRFLFISLCAPALLIAGCATPLQTAGLAVGVTAAGAHSPTTEIEQIYYLGVFDPQEQIPPSIYRVRVRGQASMISVAKFASGWVPAGVADSLTTRIEYSDEGPIKVSRTDKSEEASLKTGRRLVLFGPEGFRQAPRDHRLVIIMGSNPSKYFQAVNEAMAAMAMARRTDANETAIKQILFALARLHSEKGELQRMLDELPSQPAITD